jgi:ankyrin repeat protein
VAALLPAANVNATQPDGATALHWAAHWDDLGLVQLLIRAKANVNAANDLGVTPLLVACADASPAVVTALLDAGADAKTKMPSGETALMMASRTGRAETVRALLLHGADVNARDTARQQTALMWAVAERHADVVRLLIESGADVHAPVCVPSACWIHRRQPERNGPQPRVDPGQQPGVRRRRLHRLAPGGARRRCGIGEAAAEGRRARDDVAASGASALLVAVHSDSPNVATLLLEAGADPNAPALATPAAGGGAQGQRCSREGACSRAARSRTRALRNQHPRGATATSTCSGTIWSERRPFIWRRSSASSTSCGPWPPPALTRARRAPMVPPRSCSPSTRRRRERATRKGFGTDRRDRYGLVTAVTPDQVEGDALSIAKLAIELGGDVNQTDRDGNTALHLAASKGFNRVIQLLADNGAALNARNRKGQTALAAAEAATAVGAARRRMTGRISASATRRLEHGRAAAPPGRVEIDHEDIGASSDRS